ncbi:hypothetical protein SDC9_85692 [bioreactor metagenome]|uniref:Uncharacterized protein n=1 Tax=bioreactor metagenome TaxID=1076179 RepID=A0A644ZGP7_9ZZZZ
MAATGVRNTPIWVKFRHNTFTSKDSLTNSKKEPIAQMTMKIEAMKSSGAPCLARARQQARSTSTIMRTESTLMNSTGKVIISSP